MIGVITELAAHAVGEIDTEPPPPADPTEPTLPVDADEEGDREYSPAERRQAIEEMIGEDRLNR